MTLFMTLPEGPDPQGPIKTNAPFTVNEVTLEHDGKKVDSDLKLTVGPGETYEIHVGPDGGSVANRVEIGFGGLTV